MELKGEKEKILFRGSSIAITGVFFCVVLLFSFREEKLTLLGKKKLLMKETELQQAYMQQENSKYIFGFQ